MKFLLSWIRDFVDDGLEPAELARRLTSAGMPVEMIEPLPDGDTILDIEVFPNRPDTMNVYGMAREVAAAAHRPLLPYPSEVTEGSGPAASKLAGVAIDDPSLCSRYSARVVRGVRVGESPAWLACRLTALGMRPLNNIVDATNYVLWEYGHPLHAFDLATLRGGQVRVRRARPGEKLVTLDGVDRTLDERMLVIADEERAVALAGVMGGAATMVTSKTTDLLLECAHFDAVTVRRASKMLGLSTDASYRFERGADIEATPVALARVAEIIRTTAGGDVAPGLAESRPAPPAGRQVSIRPSRAAIVLGAPLQPFEVSTALKSLGFTLRPSGTDTLEVEIPSYRQDLQREVDLIEEVGRQRGYDAIPGRLPHIAGSGGVARMGHAREQGVRRALEAAGYAQAITLSFSSAEADAAWRPAPASGEAPIEPVAVANPLAADQEVLRTTLLPALLESVARNVHRGVRDVRLYEIGATFRRDRAGSARPGERGAAARVPVKESLTLALALTGSPRPRSWLDAPREAAFHDLKGAVEVALREAGCEPLLTPAAGAPALRAGTTAGVMAGGACVGRAGALSRAWLDRLDLRQEVFVAEVSLTDLFRFPEKPVAFAPLPRYPAVTRDLSLVVPARSLYRDLEQAIRAAAPDLVFGVAVVDRYAGKELPPGTLGLTLRLTLQHPDRTLASEEAQGAQDRIVKALARDFGVSLRG